MLRLSTLVLEIQQALEILVQFAFLKAQHVLALPTAPSRTVLVGGFIGMAMKQMAVILPYQAIPTAIMHQETFKKSIKTFRR